MIITPGKSVTKSTWGSFRPNSTGSLVIVTNNDDTYEGSVKVRGTFIEYFIPALEASDLPARAEIIINGRLYTSIDLVGSATPAPGGGGGGGFGNAPELILSPADQQVNAIGAAYNFTGGELFIEGGDMGSDPYNAIHSGGDEPLFEVSTTRSGLYMVAARGFGTEHKLSLGNFQIDLADQKTTSVTTMISPGDEIGFNVVGSPAGSYGGWFIAMPLLLAPQSPS